MASPPAPTSGPTSAGGDTIALAAQFIKDHYLEIFLAIILIYVGYHAFITGSKYIFKPAYLVDPKRGTKRYIGRALYSKTILGDGGYQEFRSFIKDGFFRPVVPHLFVDMERVKSLSNAILLDFRSVVYDHKRRMFVGSLTGVKDMDLDGLAVEERVKEKLQMVDVAVSMAVRGSASISQYNMINNAIPLPDNMYKEDITMLRGRGLRPLPPPDIDGVGEDHVDEVLRVKKQRVVKKRRPVPRSRTGKRFVVGPSEEHEEESDWVEMGDEEVQSEEPPSIIIGMEPTSVTEKIKGLLPPGDIEQEQNEAG